MMSRFGRRSLVLLTATLLLGTTHVMSAGASSGGLDVFDGGIDMHSNQITNLADPSSAQDAATQSWVNSNDDYEADTNANTECTGSNTFLAGDGSCQNDDYEADTNDGYLPDDSATDDIDMNGYGVLDTDEVSGTGMLSVHASGNNDLWLSAGNTNYECRSVRCYKL